MKVTIDVDTGGTFTDAFVTVDGKPIVAKSHTTPAHLTSGIMEAIRIAAEKADISVRELLSSAQYMRHATTATTNALIQRKGPRLGLITTQGFEDLVLIGKGASWADGKTEVEKRIISQIRKPTPLIPRERIVGIAERVDYQGHVVRPLDKEDVLQKVRGLLAQNVDSIVVCLLFSYLNSSHETEVKRIIQEVANNLPVTLSSDICPKQGDYSRMMTTILTAYLQPSISEELSHLQNELQAKGFKRNLLMVHNTGGVADIHHTTALETYSAGPVAGLIGAAYLAKLLGYSNVIASDMGGTSFDVGTIVEGRIPFYIWQPVVEYWQVNMSLLEVLSIGAGGGSIAWLNPVLGNRLEVGPQSAGAVPGPACYDKGGEEPTVTDADVVLGYLNPSYFHGGRTILNKDKAVNAVKKIADPLGLTVEETALLIKKVVDSNMGDVIARVTSLRGYEPKSFATFAYGGAGATHCSGYAFRAGIEKVLVFPFSPVFSAYGSSAMDLVHMYEQSKRIILQEPGAGAYLTDYEQFNELVATLQKRAISDISEEGFEFNSIIFTLELEMKYGGQLHVHRIASPRVFLQSEEDVRAVCDQFGNEYAKTFSRLIVYPAGGIEVNNFLLRAAVPVDKVELPVYPEGGESPPNSAFKGKRPSFWEELGGWADTPVYEQKLLETGNIVTGPALVEAETTTLVLPPRARITVGKHHEILLEQSEYK
ncbi:hydantoinase/oxoprolinase family protein [Chloroflexota bacterium]